MQCGTPCEDEGDGPHAGERLNERQAPPPQRRSEVNCLVVWGTGGPERWVYSSCFVYIVVFGGTVRVQGERAAAGASGAIGRA